MDVRVLVRRWRRRGLAEITSKGRDGIVPASGELTENQGDPELGDSGKTEAEHRISAVTVQDEIADILGLAPHSACLAVERQTWRGSEHITHVRQLFPGAEYDLVARFAPKSNDGGA